jgi:hypothetical protein
MRIKRNLTSPEHITCLAPDDMADEFTAAPKLASDPLDRNAILGKRQDRGIGLLASAIAFVLQFFSTG